MIHQTTPERFAEFVHNSNLIEQIPELDYPTILKDTQNLALQKPNRTHTAALATIYALAQEQKKLHLKNLLQIQGKITSEQLVLGHPIPAKYIGQIRDCFVRIGFLRIPPPQPSALKIFFRNFNQATKLITPKNLFQTLADQHLIYERIHPFADGNGRTGRLLITYQFFFAQFAKKISNKIPLPLILNRKKQNYYLAFNLFDKGEKLAAIARLADLLEESTKE